MAQLTDLVRTLGSEQAALYYLVHTLGWPPLDANEYVAVVLHGEEDLAKNFDESEHPRDRLGRFAHILGLYTGAAGEGVGSTSVNRVLGDNNPSAYDREVAPRLIEQMDEVMANSKLDKPITVWRGKDFYYGLNKRPDYQIGEIIPRVAYVSTSTDRKVAHEYASDAPTRRRGGVLFKINVPAGASAVQVESSEKKVGKYHNEREVILDRGGAFKVTRVSPPDRDNVVTVEVDFLPGVTKTRKPYDPKLHPRDPHTGRFITVHLTAHIGSGPTWDAVSRKFDEKVLTTFNKLLTDAGRKYGVRPQIKTVAMYTPEAEASARSEGVLAEYHQDTQTMYIMPEMVIGLLAASEPKGQEPPGYTWQDRKQALELGTEGIFAMTHELFHSFNPYPTDSYQLSTEGERNLEESLTQEVAIRHIKDFTRALLPPRNDAERNVQDQYISYLDSGTYTPERKAVVKVAAKVDAPLEQVINELKFSVEPQRRIQWLAEHTDDMDVGVERDLRVPSSDAFDIADESTTYLHEKYKPPVPTDGIRIAGGGRADYYGSWEQAADQLLRLRAAGVADVRATQGRDGRNPLTAEQQSYLVDLAARRYANVPELAVQVADIESTKLPKFDPVAELNQLRELSVTVYNPERENRWETVDTTIGEILDKAGINDKPNMTAQEARSNPSAANDAALVNAVLQYEMDSMNRHRPAFQELENRGLDAWFLSLYSIGRYGLGNAWHRRMNEQLELGAGWKDDQIVNTVWQDLAMSTAVPGSQVRGLYDFAATRDLVPEDHIKAENERIAQLLDPATARISTRVTSKKLASILRQGRFKTQFETHTSSGLLDNDKRAEVERNLFGYPTDGPPEKRTVYGYVTDDEEPLLRGAGFLDQYGDVQVILKSDVRKRTTVSVDDSLDATSGEYPVMQPMPIDEADWRINVYRVDAFSKTASTSVPGKISDSSSYLEAQIHGGVTLADIAEIRLSHEPDAKLRKLLDKSGVKWSVPDQGGKPATYAFEGRLESSRNALKDTERRLHEIEDGGAIPDWTRSSREDYIKDLHVHIDLYRKQIASLEEKIKFYGEGYVSGELPRVPDVKAMSGPKLRDLYIETSLRVSAGQKLEHILNAVEDESGLRGRRDFEGQGITYPADSFSAKQKWSDNVFAIWHKLQDEGLNVPTTAVDRLAGR